MRGGHPLRELRPPTPTLHRLLGAHQGTRTVLCASVWPLRTMPGKGKPVAAARASNPRMPLSLSPNSADLDSSAAWTAARTASQAEHVGAATRKRQQRQQEACDEVQRRSLPRRWESRLRTLPGVLNPVNVGVAARNAGVCCCLAARAQDLCSLGARMRLGRSPRGVPAHCYVAPAPEISVGKFPADVVAPLLLDP